MIKEFFAKLIRFENPRAAERVRKFQEKTAEERELAKERQEMSRRNMPSFHSEFTNPEKLETSDSEKDLSSHL